MMPLSLPIIAPPPSTSRSCDDAHGTPRSPAHRRRPPICGSAFGSSTPIIMRICAFSPWPAPTTVFFTTLGAYSATISPACAGTSMAMPRAWPSLSVADRVGIDEGRLHRRFVRPEFLDHRAAARHGSPPAVGPSAARSLVSTEPQATWISRLPSASIRPQPVRRRPGSMPRMRIGCAVHGSVDSPAAAIRPEWNSRAMLMIGRRVALAPSGC